MATLGERLIDKPTTAELSDAETEPTDQQIWSPAFSAQTDNAPLLRLDFRLRGGRCISLSYRLLAEIQFEVADDGRHTLTLDYTPFWYLTVTGHNLQALYELLQTHSVWWLREGNPEELADGQPFVEEIEAVKLTSPAVAASSLEQQLESMP